MHREREPHSGYFAWKTRAVMRQEQSHAHWAEPTLLDCIQSLGDELFDLIEEIAFVPRSAPEWEELRDLTRRLNAAVSVFPDDEGEDED